MKDNSKTGKQLVKLYRSYFSKKVCNLRHANMKVLGNIQQAVGPTVTTVIVRFNVIDLNKNNYLNKNNIYKNTNIRITIYKNNNRF